MRAAIFGCEGLSLTKLEKDFFREANPWGFIIFARNIRTPDQVLALTSEMRSAVGRDAPVLIDQEGGRVQRFRAPHWREWKAPLAEAEALQGDLLEEVLELRSRIMAAELKSAGVDVSCSPMLDIAQADSHAIILDRCYGRDANRVARAGRAVATGLLSGGVLPIMKHIPGHGRATLDSHLDLPVVETPLEELRQADFEPFRQLADLPMAMTAHITYPSIDPENCATLSPAVIREIRGSIGFDGLLMTDDLSMKALKGSLSDSVAVAFSAGCDMVLHCNGDAVEMAEVADATPRLERKAAARAARALALRAAVPAFDPAEADARFSQLTGGPSHA